MNQQKLFVTKEIRFTSSNILFILSLMTLTKKLKIKAFDNIKISRQMMSNKIILIAKFLIEM